MTIRDVTPRLDVPRSKEKCLLGEMDSYSDPEDSVSLKI